MKEKQRAFIHNQKDDSKIEYKWLTTCQVAQMLNTSKKVILNKVYEGKLPCYKFGRKNYYLEQEIHQVILKGKLNGNQT